MKDYSSTRDNSNQSKKSKLGNIPGIRLISLNGKWQTIIYPVDFGFVIRTPGAPAKRETFLLYAGAKVGSIKITAKVNKLKEHQLIIKYE